MSLPETVGWIFVAIFGVLAIITVLNVIGVVKIPDDEQRKWLFKFLIGSVVVAVAGFGSDYLKRFFNSPESNSAVTPANATPSSPPPTAAPSTSPSTATPTPTPASSPTPSATIAGVPEAIQPWVESTLGARPTLADIDEHPYPSCVGELRTLAADAVLAQDAAACVHAIDRYQVRYLIGYYTMKQAYADKLDVQEERLRPHATDTETMPRYSFVVSEIARLNGAEWDQVTALDKRLREDRASCARNKCQAQP